MVSQLGTRITKAETRSPMCASGVDRQRSPENRPRKLEGRRPPAGSGRMRVHGASIRQAFSGLSPGSRSAWRRFQPDAPRFVTRSPVRPYLAMPPAPCHPFPAAISCGRLRNLRAAECHKGDVRDDRNERGMNRRSAGAHRRQSGTNCRRPREGGLNDIADAFAIIAMAVTGM